MIYVSLTTIPQRLKNIDKSVQSLLKQSKKPDKIFINVPVKYKRFQETIEDHQLPKFDNDVVEIVRCEDYGSGTKLMGSLNKFEKNSLIILVDDDNIYEDYMIEKFYHFYSLAPENAYSFYVHPLKKFGIGQGADGFAINSNFLEDINFFYNNVVSLKEDLFIHDDLWISFYLFYVKKVKILSLQSHLKKTKAGQQQLIYTTHNKDGGLISSYSSNINEAIKIRDEIALESLEYMSDKIKDIKF